jgi:very-short-patch-repair endonuclease
MRSANEFKTERARELRNLSTKAESTLWKQLRARALAGHKFVRQAPIGPFIVDFVCREKRLIVEVDGGQHGNSTSDKARDKWLVAHRYIECFAFGTIMS